MRLVTADQVDDIVRGALVFGSGGGGDSYVARQMLLAAIEKHGPVRLVDAEDLDPGALVLPVLSAGAPYALMEKLHGEHEGPQLRAAVEAQAGRRCAAVLPVQLAAVNGIVPLAIAAQLGLPCLDADAMRRCFPAIDLTLFAMAGLRASPITAVDVHGAQAVFSTRDDATLGSLLRGAMPSLGLVALISAYRVTAEDCARFASRGALTDCARIGGALRAAVPGSPAGYARFLAACRGQMVFTGVVAKLVQHVTDGFPRGVLSVEDSAEPGRFLRVDFQNENLVATEGGAVVVSVPDLITLIDADSGRVVQTVDVALGQELHVVAHPVDPRWHTPEGLALVGPRAFGYDIDPVRVT